MKKGQYWNDIVNNFMKLLSRGMCVYVSLNEKYANAKYIYYCDSS